MRRVLVVGHDHVASAGLVGDALVAAGWETTAMTVVPEHRFASPDVDVTFPDPSGVDLVVTLGAPWPRAAIPTWSTREVAFLADAHTRGGPVLGICAGAQFLAEALGGGVEPLGVPRIGWFPVHSAELGDGPWFSWHADQLRPPPGASVLATDDDGVAAFRVGTSVGLQFHPEMTPELLDRWLALPGTVAPPGLREATARHADPERVRRLLTALDLISPAPAR